MKLHSIGSVSLALTAISFVGLTTSLPAGAATFYNITDLGTLALAPNDFSTATGINDLGQVIGNSSNAFGSTQVFRTAPNTPINPATDNISESGQTTTANDINNLGQVVGNISNLATTRSTLGYITDSNDGSIQGTSQILQQANAVNDLSQIAGTNNLSAPGFQPIVRAVRINTNSTPRGQFDLGTLGGASSAGNGINNLGQVVGSSGTADGQTRAFRTAPNSVINPATDDLGTLGGFSSTARDINDLGQVVGSSVTASGETRAFLTGANSAINAATDDLGTLGGNFSAAYSINNSGFVVGDSELVDGSNRAFVYDGTALFDLNTLITENSGFVLTGARGINESGQIAATGFFAETQSSRAFLLTPVPEPTTMLGVLAFSAGAGFLRKRAAKQKVKA